jgi:hypothetical protein
LNTAILYKSQTHIVDTLTSTATHHGVIATHLPQSHGIKLVDSRATHRTHHSWFLRNNNSMIMSSQLDNQEPQSSASSITIAENHYHPKTESLGHHTLKPRPWIRKTTPFSRIIDQAYDGEGTRERPFLIDWVSSSPASATGEKGKGKGNNEERFVDVENPMTYGRAYKWSIVVLAAMSTLGVSMASSMLSAAVFDMRVDFPGKSIESYIMGESLGGSSL